jgi:hypothetical protein
MRSKDPRILSLDGLPRNSERFRTLTMNSYCFLDSMSFLNGSLAQVVESLRNSNHTFPLLDQSELYTNEEEKELMLRKGCYPYEFATSVEQLRSTTELPPIETFYSSVSNSNIDEVEYAHAQNVWKTFKCKNLLEYTERYCCSDVYLLAEVFLAFREEVMNEWGLDACNYISLPQLVIFKSFICLAP